MIGAIAEKEFRDHLTSRRFLIFLGFLLTIAVLSLVSVKLQMGSWGISGSKKPPLYSVMWSINSDIGVIGGIFALALGFDAITREREERTLKVLMGHPVFRDQVILGKVLGGAITLAFAVLISALAITGTILWVGITVDSYARLATYFLFMYLYLFLFFAMAVAFSTYARNSGNSLMYALVVFLALIVVVMTIAPIVAHFMVGPQPKMPPKLQELEEKMRTGGNLTASEMMELQRLMEEYQNRTQEWSKRYWRVQRYITALSPMNDFDSIAQYVLNPYAKSPNEVEFFYSPQEGKESTHSLWESLSYAKTEIAVLVGYTVLWLVLAYLGFVRAEIR